MPVGHGLDCDGIIHLGELTCSCGRKHRHVVTRPLGLIRMRASTKDGLTAAITFALVLLIIGLVAAPWVGILLFLDAPGVALFWTAVVEAAILVVACAIALGALNN